MKIEKHRVKSVFQKYTDCYNVSDEKIKLKIEHTYRVADLCERIAESLGMREEEKNLAWLLGMLHDVGRFEQLRKFGTFVDAVSVDHAELGADLLFHTTGKSGYATGAEKGGIAPECPWRIPDIREYVSDSSEDQLIEAAVRIHSAYRIPDEMTERTRLFARILRDADKIDILKVNVEVPLEEIYNASTEEILQADITKEVLQSFYEHHAVVRSLKKTPVDNLVGHCALVFELEFPESLRIVKEQGYLDRMLEFKSNNRQTTEKFSEMRIEMEKYLKGKLENNKINQ